MSDKSTQSIMVEAQPDAIMSVIADFESYPTWAHGVKAIEVTERYPDGKAKEVHFTVDVGVVKDEYTLAYDWAADGNRVDWHMLKGKMQRQQDGSYEMRPNGSGQTEVVYTLAVELLMPMLPMLKRKAENMIMDIALKGLKARVESRAGA